MEQLARNAVTEIIYLINGTCLKHEPDKWVWNPRTHLLKIPCFSVDSVANDLFTSVISLKSAPFI